THAAFSTGTKSLLLSGFGVVRLGLFVVAFGATGFSSTIAIIQILIYSSQITMLPGPVAMWNPLQSSFVSHRTASTTVLFSEAFSARVVIFVVAFVLSSQSVSCSKGAVVK